MRLNKEELAVGAVFGAAWFWFMGFWTLAYVPAAAMAWAMGGSQNKLYRRIGCAIMVAAVCLWAKTVWFGALGAGMATFGVLSMGYGIPTTQPYDEGSTIGKFVYGLVGREKEASVIVRMLIGFMLGIAAIPLAGVSALGWAIACAVLVIGMPLAFLFVEGEINV